MLLNNQWGQIPYLAPHTLIVHGIYWCLQLECQPTSHYSIAVIFHRFKQRMQIWVDLQNNTLAHLRHSTRLRGLYVHSTGSCTLLHYSPLELVTLKRSVFKLTQTCWFNYCWGWLQENHSHLIRMKRFVYLFVWIMCAYLMIWKVLFEYSWNLSQ